jgi:hypothetical protein
VKSKLLTNGQIIKLVDTVSNYILKNLPSAKAASFQPRKTNKSDRLKDAMHSKYDYNEKSHRVTPLFSDPTLAECEVLLNRYALNSFSFHFASFCVMLCIFFLLSCNFSELFHANV